MDIVIVFRTSEYGDIELSYCLKSIRKYLVGYGNIYIIGDHPGFEGNYIHIPAEDHGFLKEDNIRRKVEVACVDPRISDDFFFTNDDHIFIEPLNITSLPYYYSGDLLLAYNRKRRVGAYKAALENTRLELELRKLPIKHFDIHTPIIYNKTSFLAVTRQYDWKKPKVEYVLKSLYCNTLRIDGQEYDDMMIGYPPETAAQVYNDIKNRFVFGFNENSLTDPGGVLGKTNEAMLQVLEEIVS